MKKRGGNILLAGLLGVLSLSLIFSFIIRVTLYRFNVMKAKDLAEKIAYFRYYGEKSKDVIKKAENFSSILAERGSVKIHSRESFSGIDVKVEMKTSSGSRVTGNFELFTPGRYLR